LASAPELQKNARAANDRADEPRGEPLAGLGAVQVAHVHEPRRQRLVHGGGEPGVAVAERVDGDAAGEVEVGAAGVVVHRHALAARQAHRRALVRAEEIVAWCDLRGRRRAARLLRRRRLRGDRGLGGVRRDESGHAAALE
jgi:hypothetical protein